MPGAATDIGIGGDGSVYVVATDGKLYKWDGSAWQAKGPALEIRFAAVSVDGGGVPYLVGTNKAIYRGAK